MTRTYRLIVKETLTYEVEVDADSVKDARRVYKAELETCYSSGLHNLLDNRSRITSIEEVQP